MIVNTAKPLRSVGADSIRAGTARVTAFRALALVESESSQGAEAFALELAEVRQRIAEKPDIGQVYARAGGVIVRRVLMGTRTHVFYELSGAENLGMIVALWGAMKEHDPDVGRDAIMRMRQSLGLR